MMKIFSEVLTAKQRRILRRFGPLLSKGGFYLAGGTALAMQLGHRKSVDLGWFTNAKISDPLRLANELKREDNQVAIDTIDQGTLHCTIADVRLSFLEYPHPLLKRLIAAREYACRLAAPADIAAMKLAAVSQRGAKKDFIDVYALLESGYPLEELLAFYAKKYSVSDRGHVLYSLAYFEDADQDQMPSMLWKVDWLAIKRKIAEAIRQTASL